MAYFKNRRPRRKTFAAGNEERPECADLIDPERTGSEAAYMTSLIDSRAAVTVVLKNGGKLRGRIRYSDRDCFSLGLASNGPNVFLRKSSVGYFYEE